MNGIFLFYHPYKDGGRTQHQRHHKQMGVEEECASAASGAEELECGEAGKLRGWDRLERWEAGTGWKAGASAHHSPFTVVDVYNHCQFSQQGSTATIASSRDNLLAFGDVDELPAVVDAESRVRARSVLD